MTTNDTAAARAREIVAAKITDTVMEHIGCEHPITGTQAEAATTAVGALLDTQRTTDAATIAEQARRLKWWEDTYERIDAEANDLNKAGQQHATWKAIVERDRARAEIDRLTRAVEEARARHDDDEHTISVLGDTATALMAERDRYRDEAEAAKVQVTRLARLEAAAPPGLRYEAMQGDLRRLMNERDEMRLELSALRTEARTLAADLGRMRAALEKIVKFTNGPTTETWTREGVIARARAALTPAPPPLADAVRLVVPNPTEGESR